MPRNATVILRNSSSTIISFPPSAVSENDKNQVVTSILLEEYLLNQFLPSLIYIFCFNHQWNRLCALFTNFLVCRHFWHSDSKLLYQFRVWGLCWVWVNPLDSSTGMSCGTRLCEWWYHWTRFLHIWPHFCQWVPFINTQYSYFLHPRVLWHWTCSGCNMHQKRSSSDSI